MSNCQVAAVTILVKTASVERSLSAGDNQQCEMINGQLQQQPAFLSEIGAQRFSAADNKMIHSFHY